MKVVVVKMPGLFGKFLKMLRMRYAAQDVYDSFKSLSSISEEYGYQSKQFFSVFREPE